MSALSMLGAIALMAAQALSPADTAAAFAAAGFKHADGEWRTDCYQPDGPAYEAGRIDQAADLNADGQPEAIIVEGSLFCYGDTGTGFVLVSKQAGGKWVKLYASPGIPRMLDTRRNGWPEIELGGPGFCYPVLGWSGGKFGIVRHEYEGKPCRP